MKALLVENFLRCATEGVMLVGRICGSMTNCVHDVRPTPDFQFFAWFVGVGQPTFTPLHRRNAYRTCDL